MASPSDRLVIAAEFENVAAARRFVRAALEAAPAQVAADLQLAASELVTNAIEHGSGERITVDVEAASPRFTVAITSADAAAGIVPEHRWAVAEASSRYGRGLGIVSKIADDVDVRRRGDLLTITVTRDARRTLPGSVAG